MYIIIFLFAFIFLALNYLLIVRPVILIKSSGIDMGLPEFFKFQSKQMPVIRLLQISAKFKKYGIQLLWSDINLFYQSAKIETQTNPVKFQKPPEELLNDVLEVLNLVKEQGYEMSFQNVSLQILAGKNPREIVSSFVHTMWHGTKT